MSNGPERTTERANKPNPAVDDRPRGISEAAITGAAKGKPEADNEPAADARVTPKRDEDADDNGSP